MLNEAPRKKKQEKPEERLYNPKLDLNSCLQQAFNDLKHERSQHGWNILVEELKGVTMQRRGTDGFSISYQKYFVGNQHDAQNYEQEAKKFLGDILKELKKHFKKLSGKVLEVKKVDESKNVDKYSRLTAEHQSLYGGTTYGGMIGRFHLTYTHNFKISAPKPATGTPGGNKPVWG
ncbi:MAG: hypothetical protein Q8Q92_03370 [bacterium]|nr:hypothetical protein [bacterium]